MIKKNNMDKNLIRLEIMLLLDFCLLFSNHILDIFQIQNPIFK